MTTFDGERNVSNTAWNCSMHTDKRKSGGQRTLAERQARYRAKMADAGLKRVTVFVPPERENDIKSLAERIREGMI